MNRTAVLSRETDIPVALGLYPGISRFALDLVHGEGAAGRLLHRRSRPTEPRRGLKRPAELARALEQTNLAWGNDVSAQLEQWRDGETLALIAGQQVGFAGGPLYTLAKVASLIAMKRELEACGVEATVFFWMATEDHDFAEVATLDLQIHEHLRRLSMEELPGDPRPVGALPLPEPLVEQLRAFFPKAPMPWLEPGISFRDSFAMLMAKVFHGEGVILVDSLLPELRAEGAELVKSVIGRWDELQSAVRQKSDDIAAAGYRPQIEAGEEGEYAFLFLLRDGFRLPLRKSEGRWLADGRHVEEEELLRILDQEPWRISTAAMVRPLLQDAVFQPDVFIGGPAECAYYAQVAALHQRLEVEIPYVALRGHVLVAPARILEFVQKYELDPAELFADTDELLLKREGTATRELDRMIANLSSDLERGIGDVAAFVTTADRGLQKSIERTMRHLRYHVAKLSERGRRAIARSDLVRYQQIRRVRETLVPDGVPQDRHVGWITLWLQHGEHLVERMIEAIEPDSDSVRIVGL